MPINVSSMRQFQREILMHYRARGRDLPWRHTRNPYRILVSEIMLQQTQVERVIPKYGLFIRRFPDFRALARAEIRDILAAWQGLGYNRRALCLKKIADAVLKDHGGKLPRDPNILKTLPGVGPATAGAIAAFAFNAPAAFIETNIRRVFIHLFFKGRRKVNDAEILELAKKTVDPKNPREWHWALMDYGALLGVRASRASRKMENPNRKSAHYHRQSPFRGSNRELRGNILKLLLRKKTLRENDLAKFLSEPHRRVRRALAALRKDGLIITRARVVSIAK